MREFVEYVWRQLLVSFASAFRSDARRDGYSLTIEYESGSSFTLAANLGGVMG
jgi:hypothetical protein